MKYQLYKGVKDNDELRRAFNDLAVQVFNLSFEEWHNNGYWTDKYIPYLLFDGEKAIANVSVSIINTVWENRPQKYIQIGAVMTDANHRNQGLSRFLMEEILKDWKDRCDAIYLFANDTVLDFYPRFGFTKETEYEYSMQVVPSHRQAELRKLDMDNKADVYLLENYYLKNNPFSKLPMINSYGLLMFYCSNFMKDCIYYSEKYDAVVIAEYKDNNLLCFDIFCDDNNSLGNILTSITGGSVNKIVLGFTPKVADGFDINAVERDVTLFVFSEKEDIFKDDKLMFSLLSHA